MYNKQKQYKLKSSVVFIKGKLNTCALDIATNNIFVIPNFFLTKSRHKAFVSSRNISDENDTIFLSNHDELINFLKLNNLLVINNKFINSLYELPIFNSPFRITNALLCINITLLNEITQFDIFRQLHIIGVPNMKLKLIGFEIITDVIRLLKLVMSYKFYNLELVLNETEQITYHSVEKLSREFLILNSVIICNSSHKSDEIISTKFCEFILLRSDCNLKIHCGVISSDLYTPNLSHYQESLHHNTCLNRKISIDENGEIKNCPSMAKSWGNIKDTKLIDVVNNPEFQKLWHIKKDEITKCKDCEFRHICTDCRAYIDNPDDIYSAPLKCGYDPYTGVWEEWSTNPLKQKAIAFYGMQDLVAKPAEPSLKKKAISKKTKPKP
jgi:SPASM domain peptide maturase of grasp-with-spasm system